jgi:hypothetical protein
MLVRSLFTKSLIAVTAAFAFAAAQPDLAQAFNWKKLSPATSPSPRVFPAMAYDPVSKKVVLFGGFAANGYLNDTWTFDGVTWTQVKTKVSPHIRASSGMTFDKPSGKLVMFGGFAGTNVFLRDTWLWDGATSTWTQRKMKHSPPPASGSMLFPDPKSGAVLMFGGYDRLKKVPVYNVTWLWAGTSWKKLHPGTSPYARAWGIAILDPARKNVVLTAGFGEVRTDNTWTWDGNNWTQQFPSTQIQALQSPGSVFDVDLKKVIVFGGFGQQNDTNQTWSWTGTNWVQLNPKKAPSPRDGVGIAYYPEAHQSLMFGGELAPNGKLLGDTWAFAGK